MQGIYRILYNNAVNAKLTIITKHTNNKRKKIHRPWYDISTVRGAAQALYIFVDIMKT